MAEKALVRVDAEPVVAVSGSVVVLTTPFVENEVDCEPVAACDEVLDSEDVNDATGSLAEPDMLSSL